MSIVLLCSPRNSYTVVSLSPFWRWQGSLSTLMGCNSLNIFKFSELSFHNHSGPDNQVKGALFSSLFPARMTQRSARASRGSSLSLGFCPPGTKGNALKKKWIKVLGYSFCSQAQGLSRVTWQSGSGLPPCTSLYFQLPAGWGE